MKLKVGRDVKILSIAFALAFLGFNGVQQYITPYFSSLNLIEVGFKILIIMYIFMIFGNFFSAPLIARYGTRYLIGLGMITLSVFILALASGNLAIIYASAALGGFIAAIVWTAQNSYLIRAADKSAYGANSGFFNSVFVLGGATGMILLGFLISRYGFSLPFAVYAIFPIVAVVLLSRLRETKVPIKKNVGVSLRKVMTSRTAWRLSSIWFATWTVFGLAIGQIPLELTKTLGIVYVGIVSSMFFVLPVLLSYSFGSFSDKKGRAPMIILAYIISLAGLGALYIYQGALLLVAGIFLLAVGYAILRPMTFAFVGDVADEFNLEYLSAFFWIMSDVGLVIALFLAKSLQTRELYLFAMAIMIVSLLAVLPLFHSSLAEVKKRLSQEIS